MLDYFQNKPFQFMLVIPFIIILILYLLIIFVIVTNRGGIYEIGLLHLMLMYGVPIFIVIFSSYVGLSSLIYDKIIMK